MKKKLILFLIFAVSLFGGCGRQDSMTSEVSSVESQDIADNSVSEIPDDVRQKLQAALDIDPITIPAEEWTAETLCQAIYINGEPLSIPCTLHSLGEGFAIQETEEHPISINESTHRAGTLITYYGNDIGGVVVADCENKEDFFDAPIYNLFFSFENSLDTDAIPFSLNGLGFCANHEAQVEHLAFMDLYDTDEATSYYRYTKKIDGIEIKCTYMNDNLDSATIRFLNEE
ncbi:MAG: hypothetical protein K2H82_10375 [Oscillospiraceae bacterium]|nr:hypothetical protein [Oscillospiraceae bacterium]